MPDIIGVLNEQDDYTRNRNYWKYLKAKLKKKESNEVVSATNQLKLHAPDGKMRLTDVLDGKSKAKAYTLFESSLLESIEVGTVKGIDYSYYYEEA